MPIPLILAAASHATGLWWVFRLAQTRSISKANKAFTEDWDTLVGYGSEAVALVKSIHGLDGLAESIKNFAGFATTVRHTRQMLQRFPIGVQEFLNEEFRIEETLERESREAYAHYASTEANSETGSTLKRINRTYDFLYVVGRLNRPLQIGVLESVREKLLALHAERKDAALVEVLTNLHSANADDFASLLNDYPLSGRGKNPKYVDYVIHALMPNVRGHLDHTKIAEEIADRFGAQLS